MTRLREAGCEDARAGEDAGEKDRLRSSEAAEIGEGSAGWQRAGPRACGGDCGSDGRSQEVLRLIPAGGQHSGRRRRNRASLRGQGRGRGGCCSVMTQRAQETQRRARSAT